MDLTLLMDLGLVLVSGALLGCIAKILKQPLLLAYIVAGVIIGPIGFALITSNAEITILAELGVAFLLFVVGIQSNFSQLFKLKKPIIFGSLSQVVATTAITMALIQFAGFGFVESVYLGLILAFSSTAIVIKQLSNMNLISTLHGRLILGFALFQDTLAVLLLPVLAAPAMLFSVALSGNFLLSIAILAVIALFLNKIALPVLLKHFSEPSELFYLLLVSCCFGFIYISNTLNFSIVVGAFIGGLTLSGMPYSTEAFGKIKGLRDFFATVFFVSLGMQVSLAFIGLPAFVLLLMFLVLFLINPIIYFIISLASGLKAKSALFVGLALGQASEFSFILANQGLRMGQISPQLFSASILAITVSMASTPYMMGQSDNVHSFLSKIFRPVTKKHRHKFGKKERKLECLPEKTCKDHIVIIGAGFLGKQLVSALNNVHPLAVIDHDSEVVQKLISQKIPVVYGEADNEEILEKIGLAKAKVIVLAIPRTRKSEALISKAKKTNPGILAVARAGNFREALSLYNKGADYVLLPEVIGSNVLLRHLIDFLETGDRDEISNLQDEFMNYLCEKTKEEKGEEKN